MIVCIDIGNTHIVIGIYNNNTLINKFRLSTNFSMTSDEYAVRLMEILKYNDINYEEVKGFIISSVVPKIDFTIETMCEKYFKVKPLFVTQGVKTGIHLKLDNPKQCGADLIVGAVGAVEKYGPNILIIDMGTAMTFVYVNSSKEFLGGSIIPGIHSAFFSLLNNTAKLEEVSLEGTCSLIGKDTKTCLQSGMIYGWVSLIEGMIKRYQEQLGDLKIVMTGGEARFVKEYINKDFNIIYDDELLLDGLMVIYNKNMKK